MRAQQNPIVIIACLAISASGMLLYRRVINSVRDNKP
jgi:hypothetical protein